MNNPRNNKSSDYFYQPYCCQRIMLFHCNCCMEVFQLGDVLLYAVFGKNMLTAPQELPSGSNVLMEVAKEE